MIQLQPGVWFKDDIQQSEEQRDEANHCNTMKIEFEGNDRRFNSWSILAVCDFWPQKNSIPKPDSLCQLYLCMYDSLSVSPPANQTPQFVC